MAHTVYTQWMGKMQFNALVNGHTVVMDATEKVGGEDNGPIPKPFVLTALTGCTGMDVVALLRKWKVDIRNFELVVDGETTKSSPIEYNSIELQYVFEADAIHQERIIEAVVLSQDTYCGVSSMLKKIVPMHWSVLLNGKMVHERREEAKWKEMELQTV